MPETRWQTSRIVRRTCGMDRSATIYARTSSKLSRNSVEPGRLSTRRLGNGVSPVMRKLHAQWVRLNGRTRTLRDAKVTDTHQMRVGTVVCVHDEKRAVAVENPVRLDPLPVCGASRAGHGTRTRLQIRQ